MLFEPRPRGRADPAGDRAVAAQVQVPALPTSRSMRIADIDASAVLMRDDRRERAGRLCPRGSTMRPCVEHYGVDAFRGCAQLPHQSRRRGAPTVDRLRRERRQIALDRFAHDPPGEAAVAQDRL